MEGQVSVDGVLTTRAISVPGKLVIDVLCAMSTLITMIVMALVVGIVAGMRGRSPRVLVSLHDIHLGAPVAVNHISITVAKSVGIHPQSSILVLAWHRDSIERSDAATLVIAQVQIILKDSVSQVGSEVLGIAVIEGWCLNDVATAI